VSSMLAPAGRMAEEHEPLHVEIPPELHVAAYGDVLDKTYRLELQVRVNPSILFTGDSFCSVLFVCVTCFSS